MDLKTCATHGVYDPFDDGDCPGCISDLMVADAAAGTPYFLIGVFHDHQDDDEVYARDFAVQASDAVAARKIASAHLRVGEVIESVERTDREFATYIGVVERIWEIVANALQPAPSHTN